MKKCYKCLKQFPLNNFYKKSSNKDGISSICKKCDRKTSRLFRINNIEKVKELQKRYYKKNKNKLRMMQKVYYKNNHEKIKAKARAYSSVNKESIKDAVLKRKYKINLGQYRLILQIQNNVCAICRQTNINKSLSVDHDHVTGQVRGLLCDRCNRGLGLFSDNITILTDAINYLNLHKELEHV